MCGTIPYLVDPVSKRSAVCGRRTGRQHALLRNARTECSAPFCFSATGRPDPEACIWQARAIGPAFARDNVNIGAALDAELARLRGYRRPGGHPVLPPARLVAACHLAQARPGERIRACLNYRRGEP
jgi:hypothetical protein